MSENGAYTALPNCLPDIYMREVSDVQYKVLECIARKTLGWQKRWDGIALSQFEEMTGNSRPAIVRAIADLVKRKIILCGKGQGRSSSEYAINSGYDTFELLVKHFNQLSKVTSNAELLLEVKQINCYASVVVTQSYPQKKDLKETIETTEVIIDPPSAEEEPPMTIKSDARIIEGAILSKWRRQIMDRPPSPNALRDALESWRVDQLTEAIDRAPVILKNASDGNAALGFVCKVAANPSWYLPPEDKKKPGVKTNYRDPHKEVIDSLMCMYHDYKDGTQPEGDPIPADSVSTRLRMSLDSVNEHEAELDYSVEAYEALIEEWEGR